MPGLINRFPRGLLGLLDAKTNGKTPEGLADLVMPVLDMLPYYLAQMREVATATTAAVAGVGPVFPVATTLDVPNTEVWFCDSLQASSSVTLAAGETLGLLPIHRQVNSAGGTSDIDLAAALSVGQGPTLSAVAVSVGPFVALPGDRLGALVYHRVLYAGTVRLDLSFARLLI